MRLWSAEVVAKIRVSSWGVGSSASSRIHILVMKAEKSTHAQDCVTDLKALPVKVRSEGRTVSSVPQFVTWLSWVFQPRTVLRFGCPTLGLGSTIKAGIGNSKGFSRDGVQLLTIQSLCLRVNDDHR